MKNATARECLTMNQFKSFLLILLILLVQGCRITQVVPAGGFVRSSSGLHDCQAGQTCVLDINGVPFSDTFTAIPAPGYRFVGWQQGQGSLCAGKDTPCALMNIPRISDSAGRRHLFASEIRSRRGIGIDQLHQRQRLLSAPLFSGAGAATSARHQLFRIRRE